jgi:tyrosyl-tRNA synthetase
MEKVNLITKDLGEIIGQNELETLCLSNKQVSAYWGTAPTGKIHIGYLIPMIKIAHLIKAGCDITILFADLHAYLDSMKTSWVTTTSH